MTSGLGKIAKQAVELALAAGAGQAEAFVLASRSMKINVYRQEVEELSSSTASGVGIRVFHDNSVGYAYTSEFAGESLAETAAAAVASAAVTAPDEHAGLPEPAEAYPVIDLYSEKLAGTPLEAKIQLAITVEQAARDRDELVSQVKSTTYAETDSRVAIASSLGLAGEHKETSCYAFLQAVAEKNGQMQTGISFSTGREPGDLDGNACGEEAADRAVSLLGGAPCRTMSCPVVTDPFVTAGVVGVIGAALTGESVQKQRSMFAGLKGSVVAGKPFRLIDDGLHAEGLASAPFDGEGVPSRETVLIKDGILQGFLYDTYAGRKDGCLSTGNGTRGSYRSMPRAGATNLRVAGGSQPPGDMIASVDIGFYVTDITGIHSGANPVTGDFSVGATGRLIRGGELSEPVREVTIAGNLISMLKAVEAVGNDNRWVPFGGSIHAPTLLIGEMTVSGK